MNGIQLTDAQYALLKTLEDDERIKIIGEFSGCPVVVHYGGPKHKRRNTGQKLAYVSTGGRLRGMGPIQRKEMSRNEQQNTD